MERYGIRGRELDWFASFLQDRTQSTTFDGVNSEPLPNQLGVPQGAKLAADLFLLYINDIKSCLEECKVKLFADDTLLYIAATNLEEARRKINMELDNLNKWLCANQLKLNVGKTKAMVLSSSGNFNDIDITIGNDKIHCVEEMKYLGVIIHKNLKTSAHVEYICKKIAKKIGFLARISKNLNFEDKITIYKTIIAPHFEYCPSFLFLCNQTELKKLQKLQNRAMKLILRVNKRTETKLMLNTLNWMSVKQRIYYQSIIVIFKIKNGLLPEYLRANVSFVRDHHNFNLRNKNDFRQQRVNKTSTWNSIFRKGLNIYNEMDNAIKSEVNLKTFKRKLKEYVKNKF